MFIDIFKKFSNRYIKLFTTKNKAILCLKQKKFMDLKIFEEHSDKIRAEIELFIENNRKNIPSSGANTSLKKTLITNNKDSWKKLFMKMYGKWIHTDISPTATKILKSNPNIANAAFSCIDAGKYIPPHIGPNNGVLRYTLPLRVPKKGCCYLVVDGKKVELKKGKAVLWDDSYLHSVRNVTKELKISLLLDIKKDMPKHVNFIYSLALKIARFSPTFKKAYKAVKAKN